MENGYPGLSGPNAPKYVVEEHVLGNECAKDLSMEVMTVLGMLGKYLHVTPICAQVCLPEWCSFFLFYIINTPVMARTSSLFH